MKTRHVLILALAALLVGCSAFSPRYDLTASRTGSPSPGLYYLVTPGPILLEEPEYPQALAAVRAALAQQGFRETADPGATNLRVAFGWRADFDRLVASIWEGTSPGVVYNREPGFRVSHGTAVRPHEQRTPHFTARFVLAARTISADGRAADEWKIIVLTDITPVDRSHVLPSMIAAAAALLEPGAPATTTTRRGPLDQPVRALASNH